MRIIIDGDACPVKAEAIDVARQLQVEVIIVSDYSHYSLLDSEDFVRYIYVDQGADNADFEIFQIVDAKDWVITQDYGLANLLLSKCQVIHHNGQLYSQDNIAALLAQRHYHQQLRRNKQRHAGPAPFTKLDRRNFHQKFYDYLKQAKEEN